ncbi:hypothetical protein SUGI_0099340 [Cryptomeria japonica]|nr:hypothetical protein SUGI_0099340 [Cryptomeria japonica]
MLFQKEIRENNWKDLKWFEANRAPLTPVSFLERAGSVYRDGASIIHGSARFTWAQTLDRCIRLASALTSLHVKPGDVGRAPRQSGTDRDEVA